MILGTVVLTGCKMNNLGGVLIRYGEARMAAFWGDGVMRETLQQYPNNQSDGKLH